MTQPRTDHNDLARFLDGGLSEEERSRALAHLSASDEDADVLADAAFMLREMEAEDGVVVADAGEGADADPALASDVPADADPAGDPKVIPLRPPSTQRARRRVPAQWLALAAVLAGVALVLPRAMSRGGDNLGNPTQLAAGLKSGDAGVSVDWIERERWSRSRGEGVVAPDNARAARLGALLLDLELAVKARQETQTRLVTDGIIATLPETTLDTYVAGIYRQVAARAGAPPTELAELLKDGHENIIAMVDADYFAGGAWTEAAQIAVRSQDEAFFRSRATRRTLEDMAELTMPAEAHSALGEIRSASEGDAALNWEALGSATKTLGTELWK